jgi:hypothetical protein
MVRTLFIFGTVDKNLLNDHFVITIAGGDRVAEVGSGIPIAVDHQLSSLEQHASGVVYEESVSTPSKPQDSLTAINNTIHSGKGDDILICACHQYIIDSEPLNCQSNQDKTVADTLETKEKKLERIKVEEARTAKSGRGVWDATKSAVKLLLKAVGEVSDVLPPLKAVVAGLQLIIDQVEVRFHLSCDECIMTTAGIVGRRQSG